MIVCGLYSVLLGKSKEMKRMSQLMPSGSFQNFDDHQLAPETIATPPPPQPGTNKEIKTTSVMDVAPPLLLAPPDFDESHDIREEDVEAANSDTNAKA